MQYAKLVDDGTGKVSLSNPGTTIPRITSDQVASDNDYSKINSRFVEDGSYLRLKNISLSYNFPTTWLEKTKVIKGLKATIGAQNLVTLTHYTGYDPEIGSYMGTGSAGNNQAIGIDFGRYPLTRMYNLAVSVNF